ncbi:MAG: DNA primase large subunit PriL [Nitrososphaerota archaeon]|nr:DNA primase large subunit PriL [Candidatus Calditenuaceae archaeon]MDW8073519.1 DNA primase large subunit PriL [Nitrososphaerota archaeon]
MLRSERMLAKYPFITAARDYLSMRGIAVDELGSVRHGRDVERAVERITEAVRRGEEAEIGLQPDEEVEVLSFAIALLLVASVGDNWLARRWALAESLRCGRFLEEERPDVVAELLRTELGIKVEPSPPAESEYGAYKVRVPHYLSLTSRIDALEWKLVNRVVRQGWVYVTPRELARIAVEAIQKRILGRYEEARGIPLPDSLSEVGKRIRGILAEKRSFEAVAGQVSEKYWPPCMAKIKSELIAGLGVGHFANFALAAFMITAGYTTEQVMAMYSQRSDFNERIARYQTEHIAGQRGSRVRYTPPSCSTMKTHGLCVEDGRLCPGIKNPIQYYRREARREALKQRKEKRSSSEE